MYFILLFLLRNQAIFTPFTTQTTLLVCLLLVSGQTIDFGTWQPRIAKNSRTLQSKDVQSPTDSVLSIFSVNHEPIDNYLVNKTFRDECLDKIHYLRILANTKVT